MADTYNNLRRQRNRKAYQLGGGAWFRKSDHLSVTVDVVFYPKTKLFINEAGQRREITLAELMSNYERLRL